MRVFNKKQAGFTLIELIVTMAILLIVAVPLGSFFVVSARNNSTANEIHRANLLAERLIENCKVSGSTPATSPVIEGNLRAWISTSVISNTISDGVVEPTATVKLVNPNNLNPPTPAETIPNPVASTIEDYLKLSGSPENITATYGLEAEGIRKPDGILMSGNSWEIKEATGLLQLGAASPVAVSGEANLVLSVNTATPYIFTVPKSEIPLNIYLVRTSEISSDSTVTVKTTLQNVKVYRNIVSQPTPTDLNRVYEITVHVYNTTSETEPAVDEAISTITSYMKTR